MNMNWDKLLNEERRGTPSGYKDHRSQFERDYDRSVFSTPVKRLQSKTQVFPLERHDAVRTRLTHSLEVSAVARGLAVSVTQWLEDQSIINSGDVRHIEAIAATCGLIHDLGNPPFGHAGEVAICSWFKESQRPEVKNDLMCLKRENLQYFSDFTKFEGNAQTLRLVSKLQILADYKGLNLTYGTLSASCKYIAASHKIEKGDDADHSRTKPGYFASEGDLIAEIQSKAGTGDARNPITYLVEAADDIVYSVADIEDGIKKGVISWPRFKGIIIEELKNELLWDRVKKAMARILRIEDIDKEPFFPDDVMAVAFRTAVIGIMVPSCVDAFKNNYEQIMNGTYKGELWEDSSDFNLVKKLKKIGQEKIYCTKQNLKLELMGRRIIFDLMDLFYDGVMKLPADKTLKTKTFEGKAGALLSENYRKVFYHSLEEKNPLPEKYLRFQLLTDYICGMTDPFAMRLHAELTNAQY